MTRVAVRELWLDGWCGASVLESDGDNVEYGGPAGADDHVIPVTAFPGFVDSHAHLGLIDPSELAAGGIARVVDLGWNPDEVRTWPMDASWPTFSVAGALLAPVGGYPSASGWAPPGATIEIATAQDARTAVEAMAELGASLIKVTLNSVAGPVFDDELLRAVIDAAHSADLLAAVHAEGIGQAERAARAGADLLAHAPFSERLSDEVLASMVERCFWISTLDIHGWGTPTDEFHVAVDNVARFHAMGGTVIYGTDLGNGPLPLGVNERELRALAAAGLDDDALLDSLAGPLTSRLSVIAEPRTDDLPRWLSTATVRTLDQIVKEHP